MMLIAHLPTLLALAPATHLAPPTAVQERAAQRIELTAARVVPVQAADPFGFPPSSEDLSLAWPADGAPPSMLEVVVQYGQLTGQRMLLSDEARAILEHTRVPLDRPTVVPAKEVQSVVETLLAATQCALTIEHAEQPRLVQVHSLQTSVRNILRSQARAVAATDTAAMRAHPAMLFTTVVDLPNTDVRQLSNSMRTMITDANTMQMIPAGSSNSMVMTGFGPVLADLIEQVRLVDSASVVAKPEIGFELVRLQHAIATEIASLVDMALSAAESRRTGGATLQAQGQGPVMASKQTASIFPDGRLNALLITGDASEISDAKRVIKLLDVQ